MKTIFQPDITNDEIFGESTPKGSATLILSLSNSLTRELIKSCIENKNAKELKEILDKIKKGINSRSLIELGLAKDMIESEDIVVDIYYGEKIIASNIPIKETSPALIYFPYNGGNIENELVRIQQKTSNNILNDKDLVYGNLILNKPSLSILEQEALSQIPNDFDAKNIGGASLCYAVTLVALAYTVIAACSACNEDDLPTDLIRFKDDEITNWGPRLSAEKILERRRDILNGRLAGSF